MPVLQLGKEIPSRHVSFAIAAVAEDTALAVHVTFHQHGFPSMGLG
jgi:hypothetical protein